MTFEHQCLPEVRSGYDAGRERRGAFEAGAPERWSPMETALLERLANGETIDQIEAIQPTSVSRGAILIALSVLAVRGLINAPNDHIRLTNAGFARAGQLGEKAA
jgi:hypothetical protein